MVQLYHLSHARIRRRKIGRKDLLHNPASDATLLRDLGLLWRIVIIVPRLRLQCCKEVEGGERWSNVDRRDRVRVILDGHVIWRPFNEAEVAAKLLVELAEGGKTLTHPSIWLEEIVLRGGMFYPSRSSRKVTVTAHGRDETMRFSVY